MPAPQLLQQFVVGVQWLVDQASEKQTQALIDRTGKSLALFAAGTAAALYKAGEGVRAITGNMANLGYESQKLGTSVGNIRAIQYAFEQLGGTQQQGLGLLDRWNEALIRSGGQVKTYFQQLDRGGDYSTPEKALTSLGRFLGTQSPLRASQIGNGASAYGFGLSTDERRIISSPGFGGYVDESRKKDEANGIDPDKAAQDAQRFTRAWSSAERSVGNIVLRIADLFSKDGRDGIERFIDYVDKNSGRISEQIKGWIDSAVAFAGSVATVATAVASTAQAFVQWTGQGDLLNKVLQTLGTLLVLSLFPGLGGIRALLLGVGGTGVRSFGAIAEAIGKVTPGLKTITAILGPLLRGMTLLRAGLYGVATYAAASVLKGATNKLDEGLDWLTGHKPDEREQRYRKQSVWQGLGDLFTSGGVARDADSKAPDAGQPGDADAPPPGSGTSRPGDVGDASMDGMSARVGTLNLTADQLQTMFQAPPLMPQGGSGDTNVNMTTNTTNNVTGVEKPDEVAGAIGRQAAWHASRSQRNLQDLLS